MLWVSPSEQKDSLIFCDQMKFGKVAYEYEANDKMVYQLWFLCHMLPKTFALYIGCLGSENFCWFQTSKKYT